HLLRPEALHEPGLLGGGELAVLQAQHAHALRGRQDVAGDARVGVQRGGRVGRPLPPIPALRDAPGSWWPGRVPVGGPQRYLSGTVAGHDSGSRCRKLDMTTLKFLSSSPWTRNVSPKPRCNSSPAPSRSPERGSTSKWGRCTWRRRCWPTRPDRPRVWSNARAATSRN